jgi:hypothetical protein
MEFFGILRFAQDDSKGTTMEFLILGFAQDDSKGTSNGVLDPLFRSG